ncbi:MAG TPA: peroxiredoxin [Coriobacteriia bacterium]
MSEPAIVPAGSVAPPISATASDGAPFDLAKRAGEWTVLYFYPRANTSGCTTEALGFESRLPEFASLGAVVVGVSADKPPAVRRFAEKYGLAFPLIADPERAIIDAYGARLPDKNTASRVTFLIAPDGTIARAWPKVIAAGHADQVLAALRQLQAAAS